MDSDSLRRSRTGETPWPKVPIKESAPIRASRFSQMPKLPFATERGFARSFPNFCDGMSTCELNGKVIYMHSGGGFGIFGVGVLFEEMDAEQRSAVEAWLRELARHSGKDAAMDSEAQKPG